MSFARCRGVNTELDYTAYSVYLTEVEAELLKIGTTKCDCLRDQSQLAAVVFLLVRATSLFCSVLSILENGRLDACDAVRRAYLETWLLAFEFRLEGSQPKAAHWHAEKPRSWSSDIKQIQEYVKSQGVTPLLGRDYGGLSEVAHPTKSAAENSVAVVCAPHGDTVARTSVVNAKARFELDDVPMMMYRLLWLIVEERTGLIKIEADATALPTAVRFANEYAKSLSGSSG